MSPGFRILLSAYACEPGKGSEPGVGWEWAIRTSARNEVWLVTRANNRKAIESRITDEQRERLKFVYVDLPRWLTWWKKGNWGINLYYFLWQIAAWFRCRSLVRRHNIQVAHHVTLMSVTRISFVPWLGIPSIIGPAGGLQVCPKECAQFIHQRFREAIRTFSAKLIRFNPFFNVSGRRATRVVLATTSGIDALPSDVRQRTIAPLQIGCNPPSKNPNDVAVKPVSGKFVVLWSGRIVDHKGLGILIRAVARLHKTDPDVFSRLQVVVTGEGPAKEICEHMIGCFGIRERFLFLGWLSRTEYEELWQKTDVFAFTSLRETTGVALQEAMLRGKPSIVLKSGGPGEMVTEDTGCVISCDDSEQIVHEFALALSTFARHPDICSDKGRNAAEHAKSLFDWETVARQMSDIYRDLVDPSKQVR